VDALADAMRTLARDPDLRRQLGEAAHETVGRFAPDLVAAQMTAAYRLTMSARQQAG
jgi:hypothetical protein